MKDAVVDPCFVVYGRGKRAIPSDVGGGYRSGDFRGRRGFKTDNSERVPSQHGTKEEKKRLLQRKSRIKRKGKKEFDSPLPASFRRDNTSSRSGEKKEYKKNAFSCKENWWKRGECIVRGIQ